MRRLSNHPVHLILALFSLFALTAGSAWAQRATLVGQVTDASDGSSLPSANVIVSVQGTLDSGTGAATNLDGNYRIERLTPGTYIVQVRYIGYQDFTQTITLAAGETRQLDVALRPGGFDLNDVVVSASRAQEQVLDAPASVSVVGAQEIQQSVTPSSVGAIRNEPSVDMAQTGVDRQEVVLRGFNNAFSGAAYTLVDYRQAAVPSLNVNLFSIMPNMSIDLERIEIVRGPGSALYGAGVDAGVVHFFTKDPFTNPGTAVALTGGQQSLFGFEGRHAGVIGNSIGYKITGQYARADEYTLDAADPLDAEQLAADFNYPDADPATPGYQLPANAPDYQNVDPTTGKLLRDDEYQKANVNGLLQYRVRPGVTLSLNGGYSNLRGTVLSGIGTLQARDFGYTYGQVRLQAGSLFSQFYVNRNNAGDSYVYGTGRSVVDNGTMYVGQTQYDWSLSSRQRIIAGADLRLIRPDTEGTILGRNEDDDAISQAGIYAQSTSNLTDKLDLTLALRGDYSNVADDFQLSPRAAVVYKAMPGNTFRATFNSAFSAPGTNSLFLDIAGVTQPLPPGGDGIARNLVFQARGVRDGFTFDSFRTNGTATLSLPVPGLFGAQIPYNNAPLLPFYGAAAAGLAPALLANQIPNPVVQSLSNTQRQLLAGFLGASAQQATLGLAPTTTAGYTAFLNLTTRQQDADREGTPVDIAPLKQTTTQTIELGYKGLLFEKLLVAVDGYYSQKKNFVGPLLIETPFVYLDPAKLTTDTGAALGALVQRVRTQGPQNAAEQQLLGILNQLNGSGLPDANVIGLLSALVGPAIGNPRTPVAIVQPDQAVLDGSNPNNVGAMLAYRNFGKVQFYGVDVSMQFLATDRLSLFGNVSMVSDDFFSNKDLEETNTSLSVALNAPKRKAKVGFSYVIPRGLSVNASGRYVNSFPVQSGPYVGDVESYFVLDVGAGYDLTRFAPGLRVDATVQNVLDNERREFIGAPKIGRLALVRLGYSF